MTETEFRYWPKDKPVPEGWEKTGTMERSHHGEWSILIKKVKDGR